MLPERSDEEVRLCEPADDSFLVFGLAVPEDPLDVLRLAEVPVDSLVVVLRLVFVDSLVVVLRVVPADSLEDELRGVPDDSRVVVLRVVVDCLVVVLRVVLASLPADEEVVLLLPLADVPVREVLVPERFASAPDLGPDAFTDVFLLEPDEAERF